MVNNSTNIYKANNDPSLNEHKIHHDIWRWKSGLNKEIKCVRVKKKHINGIPTHPNWITNDTADINKR